eukprot:CAMPEP_0195507278 /NCGR_PEP_ID=MMETSP0794_2-20130614/757_1 /TAXON_ID=515487 /ORGANISM="Stephanopyxis turris, Strain CCMP 815" /LENGTH=228 /DNA_ID=CAMNT_0040633911 /DNA_START=43 /DNA_END=729 /DNA_ORIENTATION=-
MVKLNIITLAVLAVGSASAFVPSVNSPAFSRTSTTFRMSDDAEVEAAESGGSLVQVNQESIEFTAGLIGGAAGFVVGGPVLGAIGAAIANFASKSDEEYANVVTAVSKSAIEVFNYLAKLDSQYEVLDKAQDSLKTALDKIKENPSVEPATVEKVEKALQNTSTKISEINEEYDLVGAGSTALGVIGDLVEKAITKAGEINDEYKLSDKAIESVGKAVEKAKSKAGTM